VAHGYFRNEEGKFDDERLNAVATVLSWAMDRIVDLSSYPTEKIKENVLKYRPLGMGFTGFGELCMLMGISYGSEGCYDFVELITSEMYLASKERDVDGRNYQYLAIAPTGTISLFLDAESTGIEPIYAEKVTKYLAGGGTIEQEPECVKYAREKFGNRVVCCATGENAVNAIEHIDIVASAQEFVCGGISKTVNLPHDTTVEEIETYIRYAWKSKCKTMSFYRDGSKAIQPLRIEKEETEKEEVKKEETPFPEITSISRMRPDQQRRAITRKFSIGGEEGYITIGLYSDGSPCEVFIRISKVGSTIQGFLDQLGIAWSLALQHGVPLAALVEKALGTKFDPSGYTGDELRFASSVLDYLAKWLSSEFLSDLEEGEDEDDEPVRAEPTTATAEGTREIIRQSYEGSPCRVCGAITQPSGTCWVCPVCGETTGCS
jgi:ribonucleoside-diphosphate reductase alpha chain